jgi:hypothetical protein
MWPFSNKKSKSEYTTVAILAADVVIEQLLRLQQTLGPSISKNLGLLQNVNGLVSGYTLGIVSAELSETGQMDRGAEKPLAEAVQSAFTRHGKDIHIWEHYKMQSYGFMLGVAAGGQEATNILVDGPNASSWIHADDHEELLTYIS